MKFREHPSVILFFDAVAAAAVALGTAWGLWMIFHPSPWIEFAVAGIVFVRIFSSLRRHAPAPLRLPLFELAPLEFEPDELLLDDIVTEYERDSRVVPIFAGAKPHEMQARIERHLREQSAEQPQPRSASDELAEALAELRRSLR